MLVDELGLETPVTLVGWSNGGGVAMQYTLEGPERVSTLVLVNPLSPYGFGETKDFQGTPCFDDYAGFGGGIGNNAFVAGLADRDWGEVGQASPQKILRTDYVDPAHEFDEVREESYLAGMLDTATGDENDPGRSKCRAGPATTSFRHSRWSTRPVPSSRPTKTPAANSRRSSSARSNTRLTSRFRANFRGDSGVASSERPGHPSELSNILHGDLNNRDKYAVRDPVPKPALSDDIERVPIRTREFDERVGLEEVTLTGDDEQV
ncbi:alpha/beta hydrolase fold [Natronobacterium gregoryi]|uniref:Alpha/beta hydrolase fold n=1 Tax=Natronobacterium gregoryi TaxID=44930 RepID=A0A1I3LLC4_9EURY|nr:alpha/beta hydrolase fold [Natronobacterium gregoryi]